MNIKRIELCYFKKVEKFDANLEKINVLVGENNSGKSSVLQGIHFSITVGAIARQQQLVTFSSDLLLYCPTPDFTVLRHGSGYTNYSGARSSLKVEADSIEGTSEDSIEYEISIYKGKNQGNIGCNRTGNTSLGQIITDYNNLFSIYVPGLAGVPQSEELRTKAIIRRGVANGDANLYLRNIIHYIKEDGKLSLLNNKLKLVFRDIEIVKEFDELRDTKISVFVIINEHKTPLELVGTGVLQIIQIMAYAIYFKPKLLLLDEPDSHLHPTNQILLAEALRIISEQDNIQVILNTHSRHLVDALYEESNIIWMKDGNIVEQGETINKIPILLDLGALDDFDMLINGKIKTVIITEDSDKKFINKLLQYNGFDLTETTVYSYKTCSNLEAALILVEFIYDIAPQCKVIIHRDRDFMLNNEVDIIVKKIESVDALPFITQGSDIESYFIRPNHIAHLISRELVDVTDWIEQLSAAEHVQIQHDFIRKRDEVKNKLYKKNPEDCPSVMELLKNTVPLSEDKRKGKFMIKKIRGGMYTKFKKEVDLLQDSPYLTCDRLKHIVELIW